MRDFSTLVPRLLEQLQRERDGQPLTSRRLVVFVFNGHNHYSTTRPSRSSVCRRRLVVSL